MTRGVAAEAHRVRSERRSAAGRVHLQRFTRFERAQHVVLMVSFLGLSLTGLPLLFADEPWAGRLAGMLGGYGVTGNLHRFSAILLLGLFAVHLAWLGWRVFGLKQRGMLWGPNSLVPQPRDLSDMYRHVRWFLGLGERPRFERFTYWEKFDYWAVFWGMGVIGSSGLLMWFPEFFSRFMPGWVFNVALLIHGEEALLAMVFIFTVHFFNGHLRPEKFPMDTVIFTGRVTADEMGEEHAGEYDRKLRQGQLERLEVKAPAPGLIIAARIGGGIAVVLGLVLVALTLRAFLL
jgi:cytochrome b subunit of formate dehydrogenase